MDKHLTSKNSISGQGTGKSSMNLNLLSKERKKVEETRFSHKKTVKKDNELGNTFFPKIGHIFRRKFKISILSLTNVIYCCNAFPFTR